MPSRPSTSPLAARSRSSSRPTACPLSRRPTRLSRLAPSPGLRGLVQEGMFRRILVPSYIVALLTLAQDLLWAAEDIEAVFDQDPQRHVCILQGLVAARHSIVKDEPIKDLLGNITSLLTKKLLDRLCGGDESKASRICAPRVSSRRTPPLPATHSGNIQPWPPLQTFFPSRLLSISSSTVVSRCSVPLNVTLRTGLTTLCVLSILAVSPRLSMTPLSVRSSTT